MAKTEKRYRITCEHSSLWGSNTRTYTHEGTLPELVKCFSYTLEVGQSWQHEKGNHKINRNPKSIATLVKNIQWAKDNAAANGYSGDYYTYEEI